ncbi:MAG: hypothetical protein K5796_08385 [Lachnospiraceae bacterium]|nr:hypothetical protein [Lachnospiraceae bacterium]
MTLAAIILFIIGVAGAIISGRERKYTIMCACIVVATVSFILLALTAILVMGID